MLESQENTLVIIRGLSGSGKTTLADLLVGEDPSRISICADDYFYTEDDEYNFEAEKLKEAHAWCKAEVETCMAQNYKLIVVHNTFTRRFEVEPYLTIAQKNGYRTSVVSLFDSGLTDYQLAGRCVHNVPLSNIRAQRNRWEADIFRGTPYSNQRRSKSPYPPKYRKPRY